MEAVKYPDPILLTPSDDFVFGIDDHLIKMLEDAAKEGFGWGKLVGLAAPQIGINKRFFLALDKLYINPTVLELSKETYNTGEGCYSLQEGAHYSVVRHSWLVLEWQDRKGEKHEKKFDGLRAQVIQHESDHLMGRLCSQILNEKYKK